MKPARKLATQKDIARLAGVSQAIVSVALSGNAGNIGVSREVSERIFDAARRLNYRPNLSARSMRQGRFFNIGYFVATSDCGEQDVATFRAGIYDAASEQNYHVMMIRLPFNISKDPDVVPKTFREAHLDAMVINPFTLSINEIKEVVGPTTLPIVYLNTKEPYNSVYVDDYQGGRMATEHLIQQGFRRIAYFHTHEPKHKGHYSKQDRIAGYNSVMGEHGLVAQIRQLDADIYSNDAPTPPELVSRSMIHDWVRGPHKPEAVLCNNDSEAMAFQQILYEINVRVPDDLAIIGYDNDEVCRLSPAPLSSIHIPRYEMAIAAVNMAIAMLRSNDTTEDYRPVPSVKFAPRLMVRKSSQRFVRTAPFIDPDATGSLVIPT